MKLNKATVIINSSKIKALFNSKIKHYLVLLNIANDTLEMPSARVCIISKTLKMSRAINKLCRTYLPTRSVVEIP